MLLLRMYSPLTVFGCLHNITFRRIGLHNDPMDLKEAERNVEDWILLTQDRDRWWTLVNTVQ
jgi:hypothetical protein